VSINYKTHSNEVPKQLIVRRHYKFLQWACAKWR